MCPPSPHWYFRLMEEFPSATLRGCCAVNSEPAAELGSWTCYGSLAFILLGGILSMVLSGRCVVKMNGL